MNRNQRKYGLSVRMPRRNDIHIKAAKVKSSDIEEVYATKRKELNTHMLNRCCYIRPVQKEFGHVTDSQDSDQSPIPRKFEDINRQIRRCKTLVPASVEKIENCSQYKNPFQAKPKVTPAYVETSDGCQWQNLENINDIDRYLDKETLTFREGQPTSFHISNVPRVKLIAEKYTKYKKNNIQVRKLDEKVVCVEYDVYDCADDLSPVQVMRAFFSIKPDCVKDDQDTPLTELPSNLKNKFDISTDDLIKNSEKEVEIIDDNLDENHPYLEDLRKILRRKQDYASKRTAQTLDLQSLYEIARKDCLHFDRAGAEVLLTNELEEIKDLILKNCKSCAHGINRHTVRKNEIGIEGKKETNNNVISTSLFSELLRNERCTKE